MKCREKRERKREDDGKSMALLCGLRANSDGCDETKPITGLQCEDLKREERETTKADSRDGPGAGRP